MDGYGLLTRDYKIKILKNYIERYNIYDEFFTNAIDDNKTGKLIRNTDDIIFMKFYLQTIEENIIFLKKNIKDLEK